MFFALDQNGNRVNAEDGEFSGCVCPACGNPVQQRRGDTNRHHFAHLKYNASCPFEYNADYINMSEWHIRMQGYYPKEERERIFTDEATGEKHIADVYIEKTKTVLEFQYSSIKKKEFLARTMFHLNQGRRIVWLFFEDWKTDDENSFNRKEHKNGKLDRTHNWQATGPYSERSFRWLYRRKIVEEGPPVYQQNYSVCVYTGAEGDIFHRIISLKDDSIIVSLHDITMSEALNEDEFFMLETYWQEQEPWKSDFEVMRGLRPFSRYAPAERLREAEAFDREIPDIAEARKLHAEAVKRKQKEKEDQDRDDYWDALLEDYDRRARKTKK